MKIPRDVSGKQLVKALSDFGYQVIRQSGSHVRLATSEHGEHRITVPLNNPLRIGTLAAIVSDIADHFGLTRDQVSAVLFRKSHE